MPDVMKPTSPDLLGLHPTVLRTTLAAHFAARGQPAYRANQVQSWILERGARSFDEMSDLPQAEREGLSGLFDLAPLQIAKESVSMDGTVKHLWRLADGELIESVLIPAYRRMTLCVSSQAGCAMGCTFCSTGWGGFRRQLTVAEIVGQYRESLAACTRLGTAPIRNVVFMGMGEPMANRKALVPALELLNQGYHVGARRITVSTVGVVPGIQQLAERPAQFRLALSLHAPDPELRASLIPLEQRYPLDEVMDALEAFDQAGGKRITFEYTMIRDINDDPALIPGLIALARRVRAFVNLIPFNPIPDQTWLPSHSERTERFRADLEAKGVPVAVREPRGRDIAAACGQLRTQELVTLGGPRD